MSRGGRSARATTSTRIWRRCGAISRLDEMVALKRAISAALIGIAILATPAPAETPKYGGSLTYMIPADGPPSFDGHREATYATVHSAAPYYSVLIRVNPNDPGSA